MEQIYQVINRLTTDDDTRQDMWVAYLSGNLIFSVIYNNHINDKQKIDPIIQQAIIDGDIPYSILDKLSVKQREILCMLWVGYSRQYITQRLSLSYEELQCIISSIANTIAGDSFDGTKKAIL